MAPATLTSGYVSGIQIVKQQSAQGHPERVSSIIDKLVEDTKSHQANHRKVRSCRVPQSQLGPPDLVTGSIAGKSRLGSASLY